MLSKQDSEKKRQLISQRNKLKRRLCSLRDKNKNVEELLRPQLDLAMEMNTLRKQKPILQNGRKERIPKTLRLKKESQILRKSLKRSNKKLMKNSKRNKRESAMRDLNNSNLWKDNTLLKSQKLENLKFRLNRKKIDFANKKDNGKFAESKRPKRIKSKTLNLRL